MVVTVIRNSIDWIALILVIVGGLNWGLVGLLNFDLVAAIFGMGGLFARIVYILVGISAVYMIYSVTKDMT
ncbi:MAG TPA: DUF378 domain-containing protein [Methanosarcina sp.]|jgi:hypothetical protein